MAEPRARQIVRHHRAAAPARAFPALVALVAALVPLIVPVKAQQRLETDLSALIRANERFGRKLLAEVHARTPDRNVAVSPISLTFLLGAFAGDSWNVGPEGVALGKLFDSRGMRWNLRLASHALLAGLDTVPTPVAGGAPSPHSPLPHAAWIQNVVLYPDTDPPAAWFLDRARKDYGIGFASTGASPAGLQSGNSTKGGSPAAAFSIRSSTHLQTTWILSNTFAADPHKEDFRTASGQVKAVDMLTTQGSYYRHAKTERFEAAVLSCFRADLVLVVPVAGQNIIDFEREIAESPDAIDRALDTQPGTISMPVFRIQVKSDLRRDLERLGLARVFDDRDWTRDHTRTLLAAILQETDLQVDSRGIRAGAQAKFDAFPGGALAGGGWGNVLLVEPFSLKLDRPFVFLVRDAVSGALLLLGAVVDPSAQ